jgi:hypothetical protein
LASSLRFRGEEILEVIRQKRVFFSSGTETEEKRFLILKETMIFYD